MKPGDMVTSAGVLVMTAEQMNGDHATWLAARRWREMPVPYAYAAGYRIGSSDVPSILDLDGVDTPAHVWRDKVMGIRTSPNEAMTWGHNLEPAIAAEWCRRNRAVIDEIGLVARADAPWHQTTVDRRVRECPTTGMTDACGLEVKNMGHFTGTRWHADLPDRVLAQIIHQLYGTGWHHMHFACLVGGHDMKQGIVWAERETKLTEHIVGRVNLFRARHLLTGVEPEWNNAGKPAKMIALDDASHPERDGVVEIGVDDIGWVMDYAEHAAAEAAAKKRKEKAKAQLRQLAAGGTHVTFSGELAYRLNPVTRTNVNLERLAERYPEAYRDPEVVSESTSYSILIDKAHKVKPEGK